MKNLVYSVCIGMNLEEFSKKSWQHYCNRHNCDFKIIDTSSRENMSPHWERYTIFERYPDYDQYVYCDVDALVSWYADNFFEQLPTGQLYAVKDIGSLEWTYNSILGYQDLFPNVKVDWWNYVTSGFQKFDQSHKEFFTEMVKFYEENMNELNERQYRTLRKGADQTPFNYMLQKHNIPVTTLPELYSLGHLHKKDIFLNGMFLNVPAYVWQFNGIPKEQLNGIMSQVWNHIKEQYV